MLMVFDMSLLVLGLIRAPVAAPALRWASACPGLQRGRAAVFELWVLRRTSSIWKLSQWDLIKVYQWFS